MEFVKRYNIVSIAFWATLSFSILQYYSFSYSLFESDITLWYSQVIQWFSTVPDLIVVSVSELCMWLYEAVIAFYISLTLIRVFFYLVVGISKRFFLEDILFPIIKENFFDIILENSILSFILWKRNVNTELMKILGLFGGLATTIITLLKGLSFVWYWAKKIFINKLLSIMKILFIKYLPIMFTWLFSTFPILEFFLEFFILEKIVEWIEKIPKIGPSIGKSITYVVSWLDKNAQICRDYLDLEVVPYIRKKAVERNNKLYNYIIDKQYSTIQLRRILDRKKGILLARKKRIQEERKKTFIYKFLRSLLIFLAVTAMWIVLV